MQAIMDYLQRVYDPLAIIVYGSYASGTNNLNSDFDALVISSRQGQHHDTSFVQGVQMDVFVYPAAYFEQDYDCDEFIQIFDGVIVMDHEGMGRALMDKVQAYLRERPGKTKEEIQADIDWCQKMVERTKRGDAEGMFRWHQVLIDSLEIYFDVIRQPYWGPKKSLRWLQSNDPSAFACYSSALCQLAAESLQAWVDCIRERNG